MLVTSIQLSVIWREKKQDGAVNDCRHHRRKKKTEEYAMCASYRENFLKRLKGCTISEHVFAPQAARITEQGRSWEGKMESFHLSVCVSGPWSSVNPSRGSVSQWVCVCDWVKTCLYGRASLTLHIITLSSLSKSSSSSSSRSSTACWQLQHGKGEKRKRENEKYKCLRNSYNADKH